MKMQCDRLASLGLGVILAIGAGVVWGLASLLAFVFTVEIFFPQGVGDWEQVRVMRDGTPLVQVHSSKHGAGYRTLDGKKFTNMRRNYDLPEAELMGPWDQQKIKWPGDLPWSRRIGRLDLNRGSERWYLVHDGKLAGRAYVVGYDDAETKQRIGYIGRNGFQANEPAPEEQFPINGRRILTGEVIHYLFTLHGEEAVAPEPGVRPLLLADDGLFVIDVGRGFVADSGRGERGTVKVFWQGSSIISVAQGRRERPGVKLIDESAFLPTLLLRTPDRVIVLDIAGKELAAYPIPAELRDASFKVCKPPDNAIVIMTYYGNVGLLWIDPTGKIVRQEHVELPQRERSTRAKIEETASFSLCLPSPGSVAAMWVGKIWVVGRCQQWSDYWAALNEVLERMWPALLITSIVSTVLAVLCFLRNRKYGLPWTPVWTLFVLLFGLPAYFGYLAHRAWPARLPCPHCGRPAPRDRPACFACGQESPVPAMKGTEVFA